MAALLGLPVERKAKPLAHPVMIFSHIAIFVLVYFVQRNIGIKASVEAFGFIPSLFYREFFVTTFTSFFMHAGLMHMLGNAYYFYIWIHIPAFLAFIWKFGWEFWLATNASGTHGGVALWAHLGGAAVGILLALLSHEREPSQFNSVVD